MSEGVAAIVRVGLEPLRSLVMGLKLDGSAYTRILA
jgi:hypothetical protein